MTSEVKTNNTIAAFHIRKFGQNGTLTLSTSKMYYWNIPKRLRRNQIQKGDIVLVDTAIRRARVLVMDVFREDVEETNRWYEKVIKVIDRVPDSVKSEST